MSLMMHRCNIPTAHKHHRLLFGFSANKTINILTENVWSFVTQLIMIKLNSSAFSSLNKKNVNKHFQMKYYTSAVLLLWETQINHLAVRGPAAQEVQSPG